MELYPYALVMFSIHYTGILSGAPRWRTRLVWLALIPLPVGFIVNLLSPDTYIYIPHFPVWTFYILAANFLLFYALISNQNRKVKQGHFKICLIVIPPSLAQLIISYYSVIQPMVYHIPYLVLINTFFFSGILLVI